MVSFVSAALIGLAVLVIARHFRLVRQRRQRLECLAREMGFTFYREEPGIRPELNSPIALYQLGLTAWAKNMLHGTRYGMRLRIFDYLYSYASRYPFVPQGIEQTVVELTTPDLNSPGFSLRPSGFVDKIGRAFRSTLVPFPDHSEFSQLYSVYQSAGELSADDFSFEIIAYLIEHPGLSLDVSGPLLVLFEHHTVYYPEYVLDFVEIAFELLSLLPRRSIR
jgi:hypothetical protein